MRREAFCLFLHLTSRDLIHLSHIRPMLACLSTDISMNKQAFDVFISFAFEDKAAFVDLLVHELESRGLTVWFSSLELQLGDSITDEVNRGLATSRFGVVVLSPTYFKKAWAMAELKALFAQETVQKKKRILPIWHNLTHEEVVQNYSLISDRYAVSSELPIPEIADKIQAVVDGEDKDLRGPASSGSTDVSAEKSSRSRGQNVDNRGARIDKQYIIDVKGDAHFN